MTNARAPQIKMMMLRSIERSHPCIDPFEHALWLAFLHLFLNVYKALRGEHTKWLLTCCGFCSFAVVDADVDWAATPQMPHMKNSLAECESGSHVRPGRSNMVISITRRPRKVGSINCRPFGL